MLFIISLNAVVFFNLKVKTVLSFNVFLFASVLFVKTLKFPRGQNFVRAWNQPFSTYTQVLTTKKKAFKNNVEKGENAGNQHFLLFPQCFYTLL